MASKRTRADSLLVLCTILVATTVDASLHLSNFSPASIDAMKVKISQVFPMSGIGPRGILWFVGPSGTGRGRRLHLLVGPSIKHRPVFIGEGILILALAPGGD